MDTVKTLEDNEWAENVLKLHVLYLENLNSLSHSERTSYEMYLAHLAHPAVVVSHEYVEQEEKRES